MRTLKPKGIIKACKLTFDRKTYQQIAKELGINRSTITNWRKTDIWKQTEAMLIEAYIKKSVKTKK